jgi:hypothetical protein
VLAAALLPLVLVAPPPAEASLPARIRRIVLHVPGGPSYERPERRWVFFTPARTQALWKPRFGTHWIVWTDGSLWPRHSALGEPASIVPPIERPADSAWRARIARSAAPRYAHVRDGNGNTVGIEVSHSGRSHEPFPPEQIRSLAWLLRTLLDMSEGRLTPASIVGHKDLDPRPAYVHERCAHPGCPFFVGDDGAPLLRRVDPPESLFVALAAEGLVVPRPPGADAELLRAEALPAGARPRAVSQ